MFLRLSFLLLGLLWTVGGFAQELSLEGFHRRFEFERNSDGKISVIRLKDASKGFKIMPFINHLRRDLEEEQIFYDEKEAEELFSELGDHEEVKHLKKAVKHLKSISIDKVFNKLKNDKFWQKVESKFKSATAYTDPSYLANLDEPRFFYKRRITYKLLYVLQDLARGYFLDVPVLNMSFFIIKRIHWMMMEQRHFHHNMLLYYMENFTPEQLGMTQDEAKQAISSIYEYRLNSLEATRSKWASKNWMDFGVNSFYTQTFNDRQFAANWTKLAKLQNVEFMSFGFMNVHDADGEKIYHTHEWDSALNPRPALAYDYQKPHKVRRLRALLNVAGLTLGFVTIPGIIVKDLVTVYLESLYIGQIRMEGALVAYFESRGNKEMVSNIYAQRANHYIVE